MQPLEHLLQHFNGIVQFSFEHLHIDLAIWHLKHVTLHRKSFSSLEGSCVVAWFAWFDEGEEDRLPQQSDLWHLKQDGEEARQQDFGSFSFFFKFYLPCLLFDSSDDDGLLQQLDLRHLSRSVSIFHHFFFSFFYFFSSPFFSTLSCFLSADDDEDEDDEEFFFFLSVMPVHFPSLTTSCTFWASFSKSYGILSSFKLYSCRLSATTTE